MGEASGGKLAESPQSRNDGVRGTGSQFCITITRKTNKGLPHIDARNRTPSIVSGAEDLVNQTYDIVHGAQPQVPVAYKATANLNHTY